jgi:hypothetical protein
MQEDIGSISVMSFVGMQPSIAKKLGTVYVSTCDSGFPMKATVASKVFLEDPVLLAVHREHYVRQCGDDKFRFLTSSQEEASDVLASLGRKKPNP